MKTLHMNAVAFLLLLSIPTALAQNQAPPSEGIKTDVTSQDLDEIVKAYGGRGNIERYYNATKRSVGKIRFLDGEQLSYVVTKESNRWLYEMTGATIKIKSGFDGETHWSDGGAGSHSTPSNDFNESKCKEDHNIFRILSMLDKATSVISMPVSSESNSDDDCFQVELPGISTVQLWASKTTHLISRTGFECKTCCFPDGKTAIAEEYDNYTTTKDGFIIPQHRALILPKTWRRDYVEEPPSIISSKLVDFAPPQLPASAQDPVVVPLTFFRKHPAVIGSINGVKGFFIIDTGCTITSISSGFAKQAKVKPASTKPVYTHELYSRGKNQAAVLSELTIGNLKTKNLGVLIDLASHQREDSTSGPIINAFTSIIGSPESSKLALQNAISQRSCTALLGENFFQLYDLTINVSDRTVSFSQNAEPLINVEDIVIPLCVEYNPYVYARINSKDYVKFAVDTGSEGKFLMSSQETDGLKLAEFTSTEPSQNAHPTAADLGGFIHGLKECSAQSIELPGLKLRNQKIDVYQVPAGSKTKQNLIGFDFIKGFTSVTFDFKKERLICRPKPRYTLPFMQSD